MATVSEFLSTSNIPNDWYSASFGGLLIGSGAVSYLIMHGRVCGISGILGRVIDHSLTMGTNKDQRAQLIQFGFILGLFLSSIIWLTPSTNNTNPVLMFISGLLVGFGTRFGCGCTSGHGICGLARRSMRSVVAVLVFLLTAMISCTVSSIYLNDLYETKNIIASDNKFGKHIGTLIVGVLIGYLIKQNINNFNMDKLFKTISSVFIGLLLGFGLILSGMVYPSKVRGFLNISPNEFLEHWDPSLMFVLCFGLIVSVIMYPLIVSYVDKPLCDSTGFHLPTNTVIDNRLIIGSCIFGIGWALGGVCPGPGIIVIVATHNIFDPFWMWFIGLLIGMRIFHPFINFVYKKK